MKAFRLGLTGSIGMGKSTTAAFFKEQGVVVWDADAAVHRLYAVGGAACGPLGLLFPWVIQNGMVDRTALKAIIAADRTALARVESVVHPLVAADRAAFALDAQTDILLFDIPLLFEKGHDAEMDATLLVTAPAALQRARVMARPGMTESLFQSLTARQMPDAEKRGRATHILETLGLDAVRAGVNALVLYIRNSRCPDA